MLRSANFDVAVIRRDLPVDHVEAGRFARAIRADQRQKFALADIEADVLDGRGTPPKSLSRGCGRASTLMRAFLRAAISPCSGAPTMPPGKTSTSSRIHRAEEPAPKCGLAHDVVLQDHGRRRAPTLGPGQSLDAPQEHHDPWRRSSGETPGPRSGEIVPLAKANAPAGDAGKRGPRWQRRSSCTRLDVDPDRFPRVMPKSRPGPAWP